jgi:hypothetical protein
VKLVGRVPVEPLDDERMTNIERRIVAGAADAGARPIRAPRRYVLGFAAAAMAAMVAGVIGWKLHTAVPAVQPEVATETVKMQRGALDIGDAQITSDALAEFAVTRPDGGVLVDLSKGKVELHVEKRGNRPPLVVRAGDTDVIVVGTRFSVDYGDGTGDVDVRVTDGVVKVVRHHEEVRVALGQAWATHRGVIALAEATPVVHVASGTVATGGATETVASAEGGTIGAIETGKGSAGYEIEMGNGPDVLHGRTAQVPDGRTPPPRPSTNAGSGAKPETQETRKPGSGSGSGSGSTGPLNLKKLIDSQPIAPAMDVGETVGATAVSKYEEMIRTKTSGEEESRAYYGIAVTRAMKLGRTEEAMKTILVYERRFAQGRVYPERAAIAWLKVRITCDRHIDDECRQAAAAYVRLAPDSPAQHVAQAVTLGE